MLTLFKHCVDWYWIVLEDIGLSFLQHHATFVKNGKKRSKTEKVDRIEIDKLIKMLKEQICWVVYCMKFKKKVT